MANSKTVLITGCSKGTLGNALAQAFQKRGFRVIGTTRDRSKATHLDQQGIDVVTLDVCDQESVANCASEVAGLTNGRLDVLVNNAGGLYAMPLSDASLSDSRKLFDLNVWSYLAVTQAFLPLILKSHGTIVNQTSISSVSNVPFNGIYNASKAAAAMLTDTLRLELAPFGVKVVELKTGAVKSGFYKNRNPGTSTTLPEKLNHTQLMQHHGRKRQSMKL